VEVATVRQAARDLEIDTECPNPIHR
jgi:hypothetical protein